MITLNKQAYSGCGSVTFLIKEFNWKFNHVYNSWSGTADTSDSDRDRDNFVKEFFVLGKTTEKRFYQYTDVLRARRLVNDYFIIYKCTDVFDDTDLKPAIFIYFNLNKIYDFTVVLDS